MTIREIKANEAYIEGDFIHVEMYDSSVVNGSIGMAIGAVASAVITQNPGFILIVSLLTGLLGVSFTSHKIVWQIPRADLVEIKSYPDDERVTVLLDDERMKMPPRR